MVESRNVSCFYILEFLFSPLFGLNGKRSSLPIIFWHKRNYFLNLSAYQQQEQQHVDHQFLYIIFFPLEGWKRDNIFENDPEIQEIADRGEFHTPYVFKWKDNHPQEILNSNTLLDNTRPRLFQIDVI